MSNASSPTSGGGSGKLRAMPRCAVIESDPEILGGTPVFAGTRVPVETFFEYLEGGQPLAEFLDDFPTVRREQAVELLEHLKQLATAEVALSLPTELREAARSEGLLKDEAIAELLREALRKRSVERLMKTVDRLAAIEPALTQDEIDAEIAAYRAERARSR